MCECKNKIKGQSAILLIDMFLKDLKEFGQGIPLSANGLYFQLEKLMEKWEENKEKLR